MEEPFLLRAGDNTIAYLSIILIIHESLFVECDSFGVVPHCCRMFCHLATNTEKKKKKKKKNTQTL